MSRYINDIVTTLPPDQAIAQIESYLDAEGFRKKAHGVWQKGMGLMVGPQFVQVEAGQNSVHLEAWIKFALLPGIYFGELGTQGWFAIIPKKMLKRRVEEIEAMIL